MQLTEESEWREGWEEDLREWKEEGRRFAAREPDLWYSKLLRVFSSSSPLPSPRLHATIPTFDTYEKQVLPDLAVGDEEQGAQATAMQAGLC
jgi:hypothetical protein